MIKYSNRAKLGYARLYRPYNDIDVYVEDTTCRNMYEHLIGRLIEGHGQVKRIIQLGGRSQVIKACASDQTDQNRPRLYVIDGDLDRVRDKREKRLKHFYKLKVYSSENLLLDDRTLNRGYFNKSYIGELVKDFMSGRSNNPRQIGALVTFELWHRQFID